MIKEFFLNFFYTFYISHKKGIKKGPRDTRKLVPNINCKEKRPFRKRLKREKGVTWDVANMDHAMMYRLHLCERPYTNIMLYFASLISGFCFCVGRAIIRISAFKIN